MGYGIKIKVWGDYACFTRPEMKVERVSYDVMTPSAARGILEAIYWKPQIKWIIDSISVLNPINFENIRRNELKGKISPLKVKSAYLGKDSSLYQLADQENIIQRSSLILKNVAYIIEAHFEMTGIDSKADDTEKKHYNIATRRIEKGQCFHRPYMGCREFPVNFAPLYSEEKSFYFGKEQDMGYMLWDIDFNNENTPIFFRPIMKDGILTVPNLWEGGK